MNHQEWRRLGYQLAGDLQMLHREASRHSATRLAEDALALRRRVEERRFAVAVVGDFRRGKSTFINALLGHPVLPSDVAPTTATVNRVTYGSKPSIQLHFHDGRPPEWIPVEALAAYVTKLDDTAASRAATIREAVISYPVRFCRNDVDILDTPGLGDEATMTAVTLRELRQVDAAILVIMADSPFSETEAEFLDRLLEEGVTDLLFVVSAIDRIRKAEDRDRVVASIRDRIAARMQRFADARFAAGSAEHAEFLRRRGEPAVFGVSALDALEFRLSPAGRAPGALEATGMPRFEHALEAFLTHADEVGLRRRFEQAEALCRAFAPVAPPSEGAAELELARTKALVHGLEPLLDHLKRRTSEAAERAFAGFDSTIVRLGSVVKPSFQVELQSNIGDHWPDRYPAFVEDRARRMSDIVAARIRVVFDELRRRAADEAVPVEAEAASYRDAIFFVLEHVDQTLRSLGHTPATAFSAETVPGEYPPPDIDALVATLTPPSDTFKAAFLDTGMGTLLKTAAERNTWNSLLALEFGGLQGTWQSQALPRALTACETHWRRAPGAVRAGAEVLERRWMARLDPAVRALREALAEIAACAERAAVVRERRRYDILTSTNVVEELAARFRATQAQLSAEGS